MDVDLPAEDDPRRLEVRRWFFASIAGEVGLQSDVLWGGELSVGFSTL